MPIDPAKLAAPGVRTLAPYIPGKPLEELEREYGISDSIKLASNENPLGPGPRALEAIAQASRQIGLYPDGSGFELKQALARKHGCGTECITLGNGSNDVLVLIAEAFLSPQSEAVYSQYTFAVYPIAVQATGATARIAPANPAGHAMPLGHDLAAMAQLINERTRLVFIANPNNPTGTWVECRRAAAFHRGGAGANAGGRRRGVHRIRERAGLSRTRAAGSASFRTCVVTRTFSKAYGLAGLRVGYALSHPRWPTCSIACASRSTSTRSRSPRRWPRSTTASTAALGRDQSRRHGAAAGGLRCARRASSAVAPAISC